MADRVQKKKKDEEMSGLGTLLQNNLHLPFAVERNVEAIRVAVIRLKNVAMDIAFARIVVANTSEGISQAPGPIYGDKIKEKTIGISNILSSRLVLHIFSLAQDLKLTPILKKDK